MGSNSAFSPSTNAFKDSNVPSLLVGDLVATDSRTSSHHLCKPSKRCGDTVRHRLPTRFTVHVDTSDNFHVVLHARCFLHVLWFGSTLWRKRTQSTLLCFQIRSAWAVVKVKCQLDSLHFCVRNVDVRLCIAPFSLLPREFARCVLQLVRCHLVWSSPPTLVRTSSCADCGSTGFGNSCW